MTDLDALWARYAARHPAAQGRPDFRVDPDHCRATGVPIDSRDRPTNLYRMLRQKHGVVDKGLLRLVTDADLKAAMTEEQTGSFELAFELIALGAPVDEQVASFSAAHYVRHNPDILLQGMHPLQHALLHGPREKRWTLEAQRQMERPGAAALDPARPTCLIAVHEMSGTGAPIVGLQIVREAARTHNVIVATLRDGPLLPAFLESAVAVLVAPQPFQMLRHANVLEAATIEFAVLNSAACSPFISWIVGAGIPFLTYVHEFSSYIRAKYSPTEVVLFSDLLVFSSDRLRSAWRSILSAHEVAERDTMILPQRRLRSGGATADESAAARARLSRSLGRDLTGVRLVCGAGHMQWRKGTDLFAAAAIAARSRDPNCVFVWIGDGLSPEEAHFGALVRHHLEVAGVDDPDGSLVLLPAGPLYRPLLQAADAMFLSSRLDPLPNVVFDALDAGGRVVLFDTATGFDDPVYRKSGLFTYVPYGDATAAAEALLALPPKDAGLPATVPGDDGPSLFGSLTRALGERRARRRHVVLGSGTFEGSVLYDGKPEHRALRAVEREKLFGFRRRAIWRDLRDASEALAGSESWVHRHVRVENCFEAPPGPLPTFRLHIHAYYVEVLADLLRSFALLGHAERILVTTDTPAKASEIRAMAAGGGPELDVRIVPNQGRDILPFLNLLRAERRPGGEDLWCHIHTKRSVETTKHGGAWRGFLLRHLLGGKDTVSGAVVRIAEGRTGLVAALDPYVLSWTDSRPLLPRIQARLGRPLPEHPLLFPMGNMFWVRGEVVDAMARLFGDDYPWPGEPIPNDGTAYHLIERLWPTVAASCGFDSVFLHKPGERRD